jgi:ABC-type Fe3+/spermidine/putrescine transport system ATPase subunit
MCFQSYALFPHLSVEENIVFGLKQRHMPKPERAIRLGEITAQVDLGEHLPKLPNQLSGGQQQRVALGRALAVRPYVILFDEPLSNLDAKLREQVRYEIRKIQRDFGLTAIYVTHDQSEALAMSDRIFIMNRGRLEQSGAPEEIYHRPRTRFVADFVGSANVLDAEIVGERAPGLWRIRTPIGELDVKSKSPPRGSKMPVSWRPEAACLGNGNTNTLTATVIHRSFQGHFTDLIFEAGGAEQRLQLSRTEVTEGGQVTFHIAPEDIVFLESET